MYLHQFATTVSSLYVCVVVLLLYVKESETLHFLHRSRLERTIVRLNHRKEVCRGTKCVVGSSASLRSFRPVHRSPASISPMKLFGSLDSNNEPLELCEENVRLVLQEIRDSLGTLFGYDAKSREVGITGAIDFEDCDGPVVYVRLSGRFWHPTDTVMARVESYFKKRIPEVLEVLLSEAGSAIVDDNRLDQSKRLS